MSEIMIFALIGLVAGVSSGVFGIGGGVLIVPALVFLLDFTTSRAIGTSLTVLLPPVGAAAVWVYYRAGDVDVKGAVVIAALMFVGAWFGAQITEHLPAQTMKVCFGVFLIGLGVYSVFEAVHVRA